MMKKVYDHYFRDRSLCIEICPAVAFDMIPDRFVRRSTAPAGFFISSGNCVPMKRSKEENYVKCTGQNSE